MTEISRPWTGTTPGDAGAYSADNWAILQRNSMSDASNVESGPITGSGVAPDPGLTVTQRGAGANMSVDVSAGAAFVNGTFYITDATVNLAIGSNSSGNPRIDTVILKKDWSLQTVRLAIKQGTAAASPVPPSLVQSAGASWEIPIADVAVANGAVSITNANLQVRRSPANVADGIYLHAVLNNSGVVLQTGDVVVLDTTADRAAKTTTTPSDKAVLGVWVGRTAVAGYGRVLVQGIGYVNANAAVTRGQGLVTSSSAKQAAPSTLGNEQVQFGTALQTTSGSGLVLAYIGKTLSINPIIIKADPTELTDSNSAVETTLWSGTIPGKMIQANDSIEFEFWGSYVNNSGASRTLTARVKYGGTTILTIASSATIGFGGTTWGFLVKGIMKNAGATNSQKADGIAYYQQTSGSAMGSTSSGTAAVDSTADQTLTFTIQSDAATATQTYTEHQAYVRHMRNT